MTWNKEYDIVSASSDDFSSLTGKTVVVGITDPKGLASIIATPIGEQYDYMLSAKHVRYSIKWKIDTKTRFKSAWRDVSGDFDRV